MSSQEYINKITLLHQVGISKLFHEVDAGQTTHKCPVSSEFCCILVQLVSVEDDFVAFNRPECLELYEDKTK